MLTISQGIHFVLWCRPAPRNIRNISSRCAEHYGKDISLKFPTFHTPNISFNFNLNLYFNLIINPSYHIWSHFCIRKQFHLHHYSTWNFDGNWNWNTFSIWKLARCWDWKYFRFGIFWSFQADFKYIIAYIITI